MYRKRQKRWHKRRGRGIHKKKTKRGQQSSNKKN